MLLSGVAVAGLARLSTDVGYRAFLGTHHPSIRRFDAFLERYDGGLPLVAVWSCDASTACENALDDASLRMAADVATRLAASSAVRHVASPATSPVIEPTPAGPVSRTLTEDGVPVSDHEALGRLALQDPTWLRQLVSDDGHVGAIVAQLESSASDTAREAYAALDQALAPHEAAGFVFQRVGGPVEFVVAGGELEDATARMVPVMVVLVGGTLLLLFRSLGAAAAALVTVGAAVLWSMGLHGWLAWPQNSLSQALPPLLLVIGVCDAIHLVSHYADEAPADRTTTPDDRRALLVALAGDVGPPCVMTSLTTAAGFASFATSDLESFVRFGLIAAFGVMAALLLTFTLLPLLLVRLAPEKLRTRSLSERWDRALGHLVDTAVTHSGSILVVSALVLAVFGVGALRLRVDASFEELYGQDSRVVRWAHFVSDHLSRPDRLELDIALPDSAELESPATLEVLDALDARLGAVEGLGPVHSLADPLASLRRAMPLPPGAATPEARSALDRELFRRASGGGDPAQADALAPWVDRRDRRVRISVESDKSPQDEMRRVMDWLNGEFAGDLPAGWSLIVTGPYAVVHDMVEAIRDTQMRSFAGAALTVFVMVSVFLRSLRWGLLVLIPTVLPVVVTLGTMGWLGRPLDVGSSMVAAVVLGIAVDDAIHILDRLRRQRQAGASHALAVQDGVRRVGRAVATTSFALALGFGALALSPWQSIASFGLLSAVAILGALVADLLVLPAFFLRLGGSPAPTATEASAGR